MTDAVMRAATGDCSLRLELTDKNDEIDALADALNKMMNTIGCDFTKRKQAEETIRESEKKYRTILESMQESYFEIDLKGNYTFFNDSLCEDHGYSRQELMGMNYKAYTTPETAKRAYQFFNEIYRTGRPKRSLDHVIIRKDGSRRIIDMSISLMLSPSGEPIGFWGVGRDVTERIEAEQALKKSEERYRTILDTMEEGYFEDDLKGTLTFINDAGCRLMGYDRDELIGMTYRNYSSPETARHMYEVYHRIFESGNPEFMMDYEIIRKDGSVRTHQANAALLRDHAGEPKGFRILVRDVTERKKAEDALRLSEERYRTILDTMEEGYYEVDLKGSFTFVNDAGCRLLGYERDELVGMNYRNYHSPETARHMYEVYHPMFETGKTEFLMDYEVIRKDGSVRTHQANSTILRDHAGRPKGFRVLARDITERKRAEDEKAKLEAQLLQAQKMESVGRLAGGVAHDFNNMLSVILGYTELIKLRLEPDNPLLHDLMEIERAAGRSKDITAQLLAFSRKQIISPRPMNLNDLISSTQKTLARLIGEDIDLRFYPGEGLWSIRFDLSQMEQILVNLAVNARDAMPHGGKLTVETANILMNEDYCRVHLGSTPGPYVLLAVSDNGSGMDKETLQNVFEPFFTTKEIGKGTGLGLATVYGIVQQNNGFINVYSEQGQGTTFKIYLPRSMDGVEVSEEILEQPVALGSGKILLVEDDDLMRKMTTDMLKTIGYSVLAVGSPLEALSICEEKDARFDLVITDVVMPGMSGRELRDKLGIIRPDIKVLFMSGYTSNVIVHHGVLEEGVHFIQKPFSLNDFARKIQEAMTDR
ncbi:MAG: PAS domain S-box protein [Desulfomonilia bacterium]